jgi:hypothetical protein
MRRVHPRRAPTPQADDTACGRTKQELREEDRIMCTRLVMSPARRAAWGGLLAGAVLALTACGSATPPAAANRAPSPPAPVAVQNGGAVTIRVTTSSGAPLSDVAVDLNGGFDGRSANTDELGQVRFADIPAGEAGAGSYAVGFHAAHRRFLVAAEADTDVTLILEHVTEATPVVLGTRAVAASDGRSLTVDVDLALLAENGLAIQTLTTADFTMINSDCAFVPCGYDVDFGAMPMGGYFARADDEAFRWNISSDRPILPMAVGLLLEQSADMAGYDPERRRLPAVSGFLESVLPPHTVSLATYRGTADGVDLTSYGSFTSDGSQFIDAVDALAGQEAGSNPLSCAVSDMLSLTATQAPSGPDDPPPTVVVVTNSGSAGVAACAQESSSFVDVSAPGIPVVMIGGREYGAMLAAWSGGSFVVVNHPLQFNVALGSLAPVVGRTVDSNHLRFVLTPVGAAATGPVFRPGRQSIWAYVYVRIGPHTRIEVPLVMPVQ